jgi:protein translocase SecG subunit
MLLLAAAAAPKAAPSAAAPPVPPGAIPQNIPPVPVVAPQTPIALHFPWFTHGLAGLFVVAAVVLVFLLAIQTTKQEGLTGTIGGRVESAYRGRLGAEEQLKRWTGVTAVVFVVTAFALSITGI